MFRISLCGFVSIAWICTSLVFAADNHPKPVGYKTATNISYRDSDDTLILRQCRLDVYYPEHAKDTAAIVWFHGGGLTGGKREIPDSLKEKGVIVVGVDYRLSPHVKVADCIDDAAAAVAWTFNHIEQYGGSRQKVFVSGHSAGGYLTSMIGLAKNGSRHIKLTRTRSPA
ncbi:lipase [Rhodopirellula maiorica SM1]|uniref:Lipase n=1 Tax=Rhodopirellula maiorica SM1 TaxID=1265738 RepID=M5RWH5_9BACT|nr:alpha/beta hydrolase [Rhodopirellula maiorica]EMI19752.1 lipase [Rhodopirellula maiorica SM1]